MHNARTVINSDLGAAAGARPPYRADIDGLRAIAVLLVVIFHAFPKALPGGFVGVDVFFVISGFLITELIAREAVTQQFSLLRFYGRRARRIFPALFVVLAACLAAGWVLLLPIDYRELGFDTVWSAAFAANIAFYLQTGYFDAAAELQPLLHLWSLGIEEQFYLLWPLLLVAAARYKMMWQAALIVLAASFLCNIALVGAAPAAAFYLPFSRAWELAIGALLALAPYRPRSLSVRWGNRLHAVYALHRSRVCNAAALLGLILLLFAAALIDGERPFPGWWALMPTTATALMIFAGPDAAINRILLSHRTLVAIGLISYPLYLWHWPLLVFTRIARFGSEPTILMKLALIAASFALAAITYRWIERPFRFGVPSRWKPIGATAGLMAAASLGLLVWASAGLPARYPDGLQALLRDFEAEAMLAYRSGTCFLSDTQDAASFSDGCVDAEPAAAPLVMLWGDSYAAHLFPGLAEQQRKLRNFRLADYTASGCPPVVRFSSTRRANCADINDHVLDRVEALKPDTIILAGRWSLYDGSEGWGLIEAAQVHDTIAALKNSGVKRIVVIGQFPIWTLPPQKILTRDYQIGLLTLSANAASTLPRDGASHLDRAALATEAHTQKLWSTSGVTFISPRATLCRNDRCLLLAPGRAHEPMAWDHGHLTAAGSVYFVETHARQLLGLQ
jgi:peptidoglycan/LPS O-acetylase OafA/YrhL